MIRLGVKIRLTKAERDRLTRDLDIRADPKTVEDYNRLLEANAEFWESDCSPEGRLLAAIYRSGKLDPQG